MSFEREALIQRMAELASKGVYLGTSSWNYELCRDRHNSYFAEYRIVPSA